MHSRQQVSARPYHRAGKALPAGEQSAGGEVQPQGPLAFWCAIVVVHPQLCNDSQIILRKFFTKEHDFINISFVNLIKSSK